ncbi:hypothetical protein [Microbacterium sp. NPDC087665]|uniref:hypothetical protein n=1 Tax=Microbacterium sp. NPDC087665 TaxID=3364194 RepID=UPI003804346C
MLASGTELPATLLRIAIILAVLAVIAGVVVVIGRRRKSTTLALDVTLTLSSWWVILSAVGLLFIIGKAFTGDFAEIGNAPMNIPWATDLPCREAAEVSGRTELWCASAATSTLTISDPDVATRVLAAAAQACAQLYSTIPAVLIAVICFQTLRGRPFTTTITRALVGGSIAVLVLGIANDLLPGIASTIALRSAVPFDSPLYPETFQMAVTPLPIIAALALAALAAVFRQGIRLQNENEALQKETEGLV